MKNYFSNSLFFVLCSLFFFSCGHKKEISNYQVKGKLSNGKNDTVRLVDVNSQTMKTIDSAIADENGEFYFTKKVPEKGFYVIRLSQSNLATMIIDSTEKISFEADAKNVSETCKVTGSEDSRLYLLFSGVTKKNFKEMETIRNKQDSMQRVFEAFMNITSHDSLKIDSLSKTLEPVFNSYSADYKKLTDSTTEYIKRFIDANVTSFASLAAVQMLNPEKDIAYFSKVADALTAKYPSIKNLKGFRDYVQKEKHLAIGMPAPDITLNDRNGNPLSLSSLKGKVVIVDFWASWCKPCRAENPHVVSIYNKYKDKGLDIFSVSLDFNKDAWLKAIAQDKLVWKNHVCDMLQWQSPVVALYGFDGIPFTCVVDKNGNIAGKNLRGPELEEKVKELLVNSQ